MSGEDTPQRAARPEDGKALCLWERTGDGGLIARWHRGRRVNPDITLYGAGARRPHSGTDRRHPSAPGRRGSARLTRAAVIVAMYLVVGFELFSVLLGR